MSAEDFCRSTPEEFKAVCDAWAQGLADQHRADWERVRTLASIVIQPHCKHKIRPKRMLPFPWDGKKPEAKGLTPGERLKRFETLKDRFDGK